MLTLNAFREGDKAFVSPAMEAMHAFVRGLRVSICGGVILRQGFAGGIAAV